MDQRREEKPGKSISYSKAEEEHGRGKEGKKSEKNEKIKERQKVKKKKRRNVQIKERQQPKEHTSGN